MEGGKLNLQHTDFANCIAGGDGGALWLSNTKANIVGIGGEAHEPSLNIHEQPGVWFRRRVSLPRAAKVTIEAIDPVG